MKTTKMKLTDNKYSLLKRAVVLYIEFDLGQGIELKYENINNYIDMGISLFKIDCDEEDRNRLFRDIEYQYQVVHTEGHSIFDEYEDPHNWYTLSEKGEAYFWQRYRDYLINKTSIDIKSINLLGDVTLPAIMNCLGNPKEEFDGTRWRRGLIIGDVQSGKTATYSGLICKAADAGYKVVILLAGITENLRQQTQERIDDGIIGYSIKKDGKKEISGRVGVGLDNKPLRATSFTSCARDFVGDCDKISTSLEAHNSLVIFVVKKNVSVLTKLYKWLKDQNMDPVLQCVNNPMLLIDDEADNASVNTNNEDVDPTRTNKIIREICSLFKNSTYVGFTATPFANVFIDPDSVDKMKHADLFPEHFIYALPTPSTYIGAEKIFYKDGVYFKNLRYISDIEEPDYSSDEYKYLVKNKVEELNEGPFYSRHKKEWHGTLPASLRTSVLYFFIANVIRDLKGQQSAAPRSMLINMSRFIRVQNIIRDEVEQIWKDFVDTIRFDFNDKRDYNKTLPLYIELQNIWELHFSNIEDISFERVIDKHTLLDSVGNIQILVVNGSKTSGKLDYKTNKSLRVIAVGGLALSRGLTLEGLTVSYFYRNTSTFDVLMQMGRWFGYRHGYEDVFQIWTSQVSADWYAEISRASNALKDDIRTMCEQQLTPKDFGIKVRDNCAELRITAANKMKASYTLNMQYSFYGNMYDTPYVSLNTDQNKKNWTAAKDFASELFAAEYRFRFADVGRFADSDINSDIGASRFFENVPKERVANFLAGINCSMVNMNFNVDNILKFINDPETEGAEVWDVVFEGGDSDVNYDIPGLEKIKCTSRAIYSDARRVIQISSRRRILGTREGKFALDKAQQEEAEEKCRKEWKEAEGDDIDVSKRAIPLKAYFQYLPHRKPILIIMLIQPNPPVDDPTKKEGKLLTKFREELGDDKLVAFAIGFPGVKESEASKHFKVNKVYYNMYMRDSIDEDIEDGEEIDDEQ